MFRLSRTVFAALVVELSPWIKSGRSYNGDQNVTAEAKIAIALYWQAGAVASLERHGHVLGSLGMSSNPHFLSPKNGLVIYPLTSLPAFQSSVGGPGRACESPQL
jgi:hypothetical protein